MVKLLHQDKPSLTDHQIQEIQKMLLCHDPSRGFSIFECAKCDRFEVVHMGCNSRLCPSCGKHLTDQWAKSVMHRMLPVKHRHCVFTLPDELWSMMREDSKLIKIVFKLLIETVEEVFSYRYNGRITPGITAVLHTFGEDMKFNVHFHTLVTCGGVDVNNKWVDFNYFPYDAMRMVWQYKVLTAIKDYLPKNGENSMLIDKLFKDHPNGFYVRAKDVVENNKGKGLLKYIARYVRHPAIAQSRIVEFDGKTVTFICDKGEETERRISMPVIDFLLALAQHIPPKGFQVIKHLGLYANRIRRKYESVFSIFGKVAGLQKKLFRARKKCSVCGEPMQLLERIGAFDPPPAILLSNYTGQIRLALSC
jgi:hypothetical protein